MLRFYGLRRQAAPDGGPLITADPTRFVARAEVWLHPGNHNHLRLTRIMQSLNTLGLEEDAKALQRCLLELADSPEWQGEISRTTRAFWREACED